MIMASFRATLQSAEEDYDVLHPEYELICKLKSGNRQAFESLYYKYIHQVCLATY